MRIVDLDNEYHNWKVTGHIPKNNAARGRSEYHLRARKLLKKLFPTCQILEEVPIPLRKGQVLYLDFFLPLHNLCVEVHGEQHYKFVPFYHGSILGFAKSKKRDADKFEWCEKNGITIIQFPYNENENEWNRRIKDR
nr:hypothetical protein [Candidatus Undinarchaeales archaeon ERR594346 U_76725]